ncbi:hypothetical protein OHB00_44235 [Streptomyces sp. NBC_00631]|uniref:hypothetical protein n=1 Tax=Streptomyces sp. NBC_00631 TaxID=2975793 RepID=UPI0030DE833C
MTTTEPSNDRASRPEVGGSADSTVTAPRYTPPATAELPNSSRRVRTRPLVSLARSIKEAAKPQQAVDGPKATIRADPLPAAHAPPNISTVPTRHATPTATQVRAQVRRHRAARPLSTSGDFPSPGIWYASHRPPPAGPHPQAPGSMQKP